MDGLLQSVSQTIRTYELLSPGAAVLCAVSGGADSVCLLLALRALGFCVSAVHVEHGIRGAESLSDCAFVERLCRERGIPLTVEHIDAPKCSAQSGRTLEEAARDARYAIFLRTAQAQGIGAVATAHNLGDQAETVLWNLARGTGLAGLGGMAPVRPLAGIRLIRPLLRVRRAQIEAWLTERGQDWCTDRTNAEETYTRNAIRHRVLPELEKRNARAAEHIAQAAEDLRAAEAFLDREAEQQLDRICETGRNPSLMIAPLLALDPALRPRVLHKALARQLGGERDIARTHIRSLEALAGMRTGSSLSLPGGLRAVREPARIRFLPAEDARKDLTEVPLTADGTHRFGGMVFRCRTGIADAGPVPEKKYTKRLAYDTITPSICLRTRREGDYLIVNAQGGRKKLKDYLIDRRIPRAQRDAVVLAAQGSHVLWVVGERISEGAKVRAGMRYLEITAVPEAEQAAGADAGFSFRETGLCTGTMEEQIGREG